MPSKNENLRRDIFMPDQLGNHSCLMHLRVSKIMIYPLERVHSTSILKLKSAMSHINLQINVRHSHGAFSSQPLLPLPSLTALPKPSACISTTNTHLSIAKSNNLLTISLIRVSSTHLSDQKIVFVSLPTFLHAFSSNQPPS